MRKHPDLLHSTEAPLFWNFKKRKKSVIFSSSLCNFSFFLFRVGLSEASCIKQLIHFSYNVDSFLFGVNQQLANKIGNST